MRTFVLKSLNVNHPSLHGRNIVPGFFADTVKHRQPSLGKLPLSIVGVRYEEVGPVQNGIKRIVNRTPLNHAMDVVHQYTNRFRRGVLEKSRPETLSGWSRQERILDLSLGHADDGGAGEHKPS